jgi:preprotein translocase subunit SecB
MLASLKGVSGQRIRFNSRGATFMAKASKVAVKKVPTNGANGGAANGEPEAEQDEEQVASEIEPAAASLQPETAAAPASAPQMKILGQYLKDLSFENPHAPQSLNAQTGQPEISISVNVNARTLSATDYEVELHLEAKASHEQKVVFAADLLYAGVFRLENIPQEALHPVVLIECPRMLFPFARQVLADATRNGGFPPLMLDPIDFAGMYQKRLAQSQARA